MKVRTIAGLGMTLLAAGLMTIYFLNPDFPGGSGDDNEPTDDPAVNRDTPGEVASFLADYNATYRALWTDAATAEWTSRTMRSAGNEAAGHAARAVLHTFAGSIEVTSKLELYRDRVDLSDKQDRQIEAAWRLAARHPDRAAESANRIESVTAGALDTLSTRSCRAPGAEDPQRTAGCAELVALLAASRDTLARRTLWESHFGIGPHLKDDLIELRDLRNALAVEMGYGSHFDLAAADYGLTADEMLALLDKLYAGVEPLYRELHCWVKHELAQRYATEPPRRIPTHWLDDPWSAAWPGVIEAEDLDTGFRDFQPQWIAEQAERFYVSLGFDPLPLTFWGRSDLYPVGETADRSKDDRDLTLHVDLEQDVRTLMNIRPGFEDFLAAHRQLGLVYLDLAVGVPGVPPVLRGSGNGALPDALGELGVLAARQVPYLQAVGVLPSEQTPEPIRRLMSEALRGPVVSLPFVCGTVAHWEHDLYTQDLARHQFNTRWWEYAGRFQGLEAPSVRGEDHCDPAALALLYERPGHAYDRALGLVVAHQLHRYICREILKQDSGAALYTDEHNVGRFLQSLMAPGATRDWLVVLRQAIGEEPSSDALVAYYQPLLEWLQAQNAGRDTAF